MKILILDAEETNKAKGGNTGGPATPAFQPYTPFGNDISDFIGAMRSLGFQDSRIGEALLDGVSKGLPKSATLASR